MTVSGERPAFFDGQRLAAADLAGLEAHHRLARWEHNRTLHQPGVGNGYAVGGARGDRVVRVGPGYAIDALGREIVLVDDVELPVPPVAADPDGRPVTYDLTVRYPPDEALPAAETRDGVCAPRGAVRLREEPLTCWVRLARDLDDRLRPVDPAHARSLDDGTAVTLARVAVAACALAGAPDPAPRRSAHPAELPRIGHGTAVVAWQEWTSGDRVIGLTGAVATGGFRTVPAHTARVDADPGNRPLSGTGGQQGDRFVVVDGPVTVEGESRDGFTARLVLLGGGPAGFGLPAGLTAAGRDELLALASEHWRVSWLAVEG